ncbi:STAS domain-containing protein [Actinomadura rudentiformis]|uniref:Anti-sigma factor antagonist n=1 Tax=Actinomadura rudentiformis TaxID=359158 RepID=A0A6H9YUE4_9ACTN|nr:STAS domain-containing protein [Actinomadura rudentiformis]KAB2343384.1 STAS domain-containing protein [Actinomadura rudentiformis]
MTPSHARGAEQTLSVLRRPAYTVVRLRGELDLATAPPLRDRLSDVIRTDTRLLILDLSAVSFCDATGLTVLTGVRRRASVVGAALVVAAPCSQVTKLLRATGLERDFTIRATVADALAWPLTRHAAIRPCRAQAPALR